ncbi:MAG: UDP-N-acetylglucosamine 1-carboxyvinyltransferase [Clostridia bacterium]|nr:UDP-N-acetylglucosamine 1-carboxyvinyltransferase [Clostridia bacterium]
MYRYVLEGRKELRGEINIQGAKNSALPILAATLVVNGESVIHNCPVLTDVEASVRILRYLGCRIKREGTTIIVDSSNILRDDIPAELMREMRSSVIFLGALLSRTGHARISLPGGCDLGPRPIDLHLKALRKMGVVINEFRGNIDCMVTDGIEGCQVALGFPSVGATENIILSAVMAKGTTIITNAAAEPEIVDLCDFLNSCGAKITTGESGTIIIDGVDSLYGTQHSIIPDRIVAATYMSAVAVSTGCVTLHNIIPSHLSSIIPVFEESGCNVQTSGLDLTITAPRKLRSLRLIRTMPYPGFPTDAQPPLMAMATQADGTTVFVENIFENRYKHVGELIRLGAKISVEGKVAVIEGPTELYGTDVYAQDLRGAAALVVAGLAAEGKTTVYGVEYLERGYEEFDVGLSLLGASIRKI